jgi:glycosyltransferase involved in cell wall biosynthesis
VLTENARSILFPESAASGFDRQGRPVEVIPCCVDLERFSLRDEEGRREVRKELGLDGRKVIVHVGSLHGLYLTTELADLLAAARSQDPAVYALFLTQSDPRHIAPLLAERGFGVEDHKALRVDPAEVPKYLAASDIALSFVKAGYATASRSPTKIPEYLACGLPIIANQGVGDTDALIASNGVGVLLSEFSEAAYREALERITKLAPNGERCRDVAVREFKLETVGGERYRRLYRRLLHGE